MFVYITYNGYKIRKHSQMVMVNGAILSFFLECSIKPNCMSSISAAELDSNLIWIYTDWQSSLFTSLYFGLLPILWFFLSPISVVSFLSACSALFISTKPTTFLAATSFLALCLCFYTSTVQTFLRCLK